MIKPIMYKKRKFTPKKKTVKKYPKEKTNKWAPKVSTKEYKFSDNLVVAASLSTFAIGGFTQWMNQITLGATQVNRIGNVIKMKTLHFKAFITPSTNPSVVPLYPNIIRIAIVYDAQPNGAALPPTIDQVFQTYNSSGATETSVFSGVNIGNRARFTVLRDYIRCTGRIDYDNDNITPIGGISTPANGCGGGQGSEKSGQMFLIDDFIQINMPTVYKNAQAGTLADITTGALFCMMYTSQQSGTWAINFASRLTFKEEQN